MNVAIICYWTYYLVGLKWLERAYEMVMIISTDLKYINGNKFDNIEIMETIWLITCE
jgi:hypothetical protein